MNSPAITLLIPPPRQRGSASAVHLGFPSRHLLRVAQSLVSARDINGSRLRLTEEKSCWFARREIRLSPRARARPRFWAFYFFSFFFPQQQRCLRAAYLMLLSKPLTFSDPLLICMSHSFAPWVKPVRLLKNMQHCDFYIFVIVMFLPLYHGSDTKLCIPLPNSNGKTTVGKVIFIFFFFPTLANPLSLH